VYCAESKPEMRTKCQAEPLQTEIAVLPSLSLSSLSATSASERPCRPTGRPYSSSSSLPVSLASMHKRSKSFGPVGSGRAKRRVLSAPARPGIRDGVRTSAPTLSLAPSLTPSLISYLTSSLTPSLTPSPAGPAAAVYKHALPPWPVNAAWHFGLGSKWSKHACQTMVKRCQLTARRPSPRNAAGHGMP
jgi:hypothetical protein